MSKVSDVAGSGQDLVAHYEQLRRDAMSASAGGSEGLFLFFRSGMVAWIEAWSKCTSTVPEYDHRQPSMKEVPFNVRSEMATLLVGMILSVQQQEVTL